MLDVGPNPMPPPLFFSNCQKPTGACLTNPRDLAQAEQTPQDASKNVGSFVTQGQREWGCKNMGPLPCEKIDT